MSDPDVARRWSTERVLVTGADGFMGSHLVQRLLAEGAEVAALVRPSSVSGTVRYALRNLGPVQASLDAVIAADVASPDALERMVAYAPTVVFHLAADAYVERSFQHPAEVLRTNLEGTMNVLRLASRCEGLERLVVTSSSEIYGPAQTERIDEDHPLEPTSPYAASKVAADRMALAFFRTYGTPVAVIRPFNTFGPRHVYDVIPKFIDRALARQPLLVYGDGRQSRDFCYVDDMVEAFLVMGAHPEAIGKAVNFGTGRATTIVTLAETIRELAESSSTIEHVEPRAAEVARLCCDHGLATKLFDWRPKVELAEGLRRTIAWTRSATS